jgi:hypothetical protein
MCQRLRTYLSQVRVYQIPAVRATCGAQCFLTWPSKVSILGRVLLPLFLIQNTHPKNSTKLNTKIVLHLWLFNTEKLTNDEIGGGVTLKFGGPRGQAEFRIWPATFWSLTGQVKVL